MKTVSPNGLSFILCPFGVKAILDKLSLTQTYVIFSLDPEVCLRFPLGNAMLGVG